MASRFIWYLMKPTIVLCSMGGRFPAQSASTPVPWAELTEEEHQRMPGDAEAMVSQRPIAIHALEHLASSD
jgi:hypothetical protein